LKLFIISFSSARHHSIEGGWALLSLHPWPGFEIIAGSSHCKWMQVNILRYRVRVTYRFVWDWKSVVNLQLL